MTINFGFKINVSIPNKVYIYIILCFLPITVIAQKNDAKKVEKRKEELRIKREQAAEAERDKNLKHHFDIQTKNVQKRMKQNQKLTNNYYKKKLGLTFFEKLFCHKKKKNRK
jgi:hypothetical protein